MQYLPKKHAQLVASFTLLATLIWPAAARAQVDNDSTVAEEAISDNHITLGAGAAILPDFQGSRDYSVTPIPLIDIKQGRFFARVGDGIGVNVIDTPNFQAGVSVAWMRGYDKDDVPVGIGELKSTFAGRAFVAGTVKGFRGSLAVIAPVFGGDAEGILVNAQVAYPVRVTDRLSIGPSIGVSWADKKHLQRYFGVNAEQAAASGLAVYQPSSGFRDINGRLAVSYRLTDKIAIAGAALITRNLNRVTDSPFVERKWQPAGILGVTYTF